MENHFISESEIYQKFRKLNNKKLLNILNSKKYYTQQELQIILQLLTQRGVATGGIDNLHLTCPKNRSQIKSHAYLDMLTLITFITPIILFFILFNVSVAIQRFIIVLMSIITITSIILSIKSLAIKSQEALSITLIILNLFFIIIEFLIITFIKSEYGFINY